VRPAAGVQRQGGVPADRVMFGIEGPRVASRLALHRRFMETEDEYFPNAENPFPPQGFWNIYGGLPDEVLRKIYHENAVRIVPGVKERVDAYAARKR
jgi:predicted TIM-barrel fold metal-dependent hydrolase